MPAPAITAPIAPSAALTAKARPDGHGDGLHLLSERPDIGGVQPFECDAVVRGKRFQAFRHAAFSK
jgi:hypothetical protein